MKIGIEACTWSNRRGYGRFTRHLVTALVEGYPQHEFVLVLDDVTAAQGEFPSGARLEVVPTSEQQIQAASADGSRRVRDMWRLSRAVSRSGFDVYFFPTRYSYYPVFGPTPLVVAFHDATAEQHPRLIFPHFRSRLLWRIKSRLALFQADRLLTVSAASRRQIALAFHLEETEISVISEGADPIFQPRDLGSAAAAVRERYRLPTADPLILYVGGISPHKNLDGLLRALAAVPGSWHAVLVGDYQRDSFWGCHGELVELVTRLGLDGRVTFTGYVPDDDLAWLYCTATLLALPSMSEGFGLPVLEAMACGLPVAASTHGSLPEVLGGAGLLFDPQSPDEMASIIGRLLQDPALRAALRDKGLARADDFSWHKGAERLLAIFAEVARH